MKGIFHHGTSGFFRSTLKSVVALGLTSAMFTMGLGAISVLPASATQLSTDQATAVTDQIAYLQAGGLASDSVFVTDAALAIGTNDAALQVANAALVTQTVFVAAQTATQLHNDKINALFIQASYQSDGGLTTDLVFTADVTAALGTNDLILQAANSALNAADQSLFVLGAQLSADRATATADQLAYVTAGGLPSAAVYTTDATAALGTSDATLVAANTALEAATTALNVAAAKLAVDRATATAAQGAYPGPHSDSVYRTDVTAALGTNDVALVAANTALTAATAALNAAAAKFAADQATAAIDQAAYAATIGAACGTVPVCANDVTYMGGTSDAVLVAGNAALFAANAAIAGGPANQLTAQINADVVTAGADQTAYVALGTNTDSAWVNDNAASTLPPVTATDDAILQAANAAIEAATAALTSYTADRAAGIVDRAAYVTAGGLATNVLYTTDASAALLTVHQAGATGAPATVEAALEAANDSLEAATATLVAAAAAAAATLAAAVTAATADQVAYLFIGGLASDPVYSTDVTLAAGTDAALIVAANAALVTATVAIYVATTAANAAAAKLLKDQATAAIDQVAYLQAGGLASNAVFTTDATAAIGTDDAALVAANTDLEAATAALTAATKLPADKVTSTTDLAAYLAAGGLATDAVYTADVTAAAGTNDATLVAANTALAAATTALTAAAATKLAADKVTAGTAQTAYTAAGGLATDAVYTADVTAAAGTNDATLVAANTALAAATTALAVAVPSVPRTVTATGGQNSITVSWTAPASIGGSAITSYVVTGTNGNTTVSCGAVVASALTCTLLGLADATAYAVSVVAANTHGASAAGTASATTLPAVTKPPVVVPFRVTGVHGTAVAGRTVTLTISGNGFFGQPRITSSVAGTRAVVSHDNGTLLTVRVTTRVGTPRGVGTFTVRLANGKAANVKYNHG